MRVFNRLEDMHTACKTSQIGAALAATLSSVPTVNSLPTVGFKSFRDRAMLGPLDDFTCVVGPNGCGKSVVVSTEHLH